MHSYCLILLSFLSSSSFAFPFNEADLYDLTARAAKSGDGVMPGYKYYNSKTLKPCKPNTEESKGDPDVCGSNWVALPPENQKKKPKKREASEGFNYIDNLDLITRDADPEPFASSSDHASLVDLSTRAAEFDVSKLPQFEYRNSQGKSCTPNMGQCSGVLGLCENDCHRVPPLNTAPTGDIKKTKPKKRETSDASAYIDDFDLIARDAEATIADYLSARDGTHVPSGTEYRDTKTGKKCTPSFDVQCAGNIKSCPAPNPTCILVRIRSEKPKPNRRQASQRFADLDELDLITRDPDAEVWDEESSYLVARSKPLDLLERSKTYNLACGCVKPGCCEGSTLRKPVGLSSSMMLRQRDVLDSSHELLMAREIEDLVEREDEE